MMLAVGKLSDCSTVAMYVILPGHDQDGCLQTQLRTPCLPVTTNCPSTAPSSPLQVSRNSPHPIMRSHPPPSRYQDEPRILESHRQNFLPFAYRC
jgi:hypothetical protein